MINLGRSIARVLEQYSEVDVPGIGVFKMTYVSAQYDERVQAFVPPARHITLRAGARHDGFSIVDYLKVQYNWSEEESKAIFERALVALSDKLRQHEVVFLDELGYLAVERKDLVYRPIDTEHIGLSSVKEWPQAILGQKGEENGLQEDAKGRGRVWIWVAAIILILIIAGFSAWTLQPKWFTAINVTALAPSADEADDVEGVDPNQGDQMLATVDIDSLSLVQDSGNPALPESIFVISDYGLLGSDASNPAQTLPAVVYEIIIGAHNSVDEAVAHVGALKAKGYGNVRILSRQPGSRHHRVSWGAFATQEEAASTVRKVQQEIEPTAWIDRVRR